MFIQQVAKKLNITTRTIRHYEDMGIIKSDRLENNYRVYDEKNYDKLKFLVRARNLGFSLKECKELIKLFEKVTGQKVNFKIGARRSGDAMAAYSDNSKAIRVLNWKPRLELEEALLSAWNWEKKKLNLFRQSYYHIHFLNNY